MTFGTNAVIGEWERLEQTVAVDSGLIVIGDPAYVEVEPDGFADELVQPAGFGSLAVMTGFGDGVYDVYVRRVSEPGWGERIAAVKVEFVVKEGV